jgi:hypothetical protein
MNKKLLNNIVIYPAKFKKGALAYKRLDGGFWVDIYRDHFIDLCYGWPYNYDTGNYGKDYSNRPLLFKLIPDSRLSQINFDDAPTHIQDKIRDYNVRYTVSQEDQKWYLTAEIKFKRIMGHVIEYDGLLFNRFETEYINGIYRKLRPNSIVE